MDCVPPGRVWLPQVLTFLFGAGRHRAFAVLLQLRHRRCRGPVLQGPWSQVMRAVGLGGHGDPPRSALALPVGVATDTSDLPGTGLAAHL